MPWYYYYCSYGPGHASTDDGFEFFSDGIEKSHIEEWLRSKYQEYDYPIFRFWVLKGLPESFKHDEIENAKSQIKGLKKYIKTLEQTKSFPNCRNELGHDEEVKNNLLNTIEESRLFQLHKLGLYLRSHEVSGWYYEQKPSKKYRNKILKALKKSEKYPKR